MTSPPPVYALNLFDLADVEEYREGPVNIPLEAHPLSGRRAPLTLGHEVVGVVAESPGGLLMPNQSLLYTGRVLGGEEPVEA